jgi:hypothetical protein
VNLPTGLHRGISAEDYHLPALGVVSKSALERLARSPAHYEAWVRGTSEDRETPALSFGKACHSAILEPEVFAEQYVVAPDFGDCRKKENKAARDVWKADHASATIIDSDSGAAMLGMIHAIAAHPLAGAMLTGGDAELTVTWTDAETGLSCKSRADYYVGKRRMVVDIKSTLDASERAFGRDCYKFNYGWQSVLYRLGFAAAGAPVDHFVFIAVEKSPPFAIGVYTLDEAWVAKSYERVRSLMGLMAECKRENLWPSYPVAIRTLELPSWAA